MNGWRLLVEGPDDKHVMWALLDAWLAVQAEPGRPIGQAITAKYLEATAVAAGPLIAWIRRIFDA
jgi:hypothetical protein